MPTAVVTVLLLLVTAVWGWTFVVVKAAATSYGLLNFLAVRFTIGSLAMAVLAGGRVNRQTLRVGIPIGVLLAIAYLLQTSGLLYTTATNGGLITGLFVVFGPLANRILFGVRAGWIFWIAAIASIFGLFLLTGAGANWPTFGDLLSLGCAVGFGLQIALLDRFAKGLDGMALTLVQVVTATIVFWIIWPFFLPADWSPAMLEPTRETWFALLLTGVIATAAAYSIQTIAQQRIPAVRVAIILALEPFFAAVCGWCLGNERLSGVQIVGAVLMISAVMMSEVAASWAGRIVNQQTAA